MCNEYSKMNYENISVKGSFLAGVTSIYRESLIFGVKSFFDDLFLTWYKLVSFFTKIGIML